MLGRTDKTCNVTLYECQDAGGTTVDLEYGGTTEKWMEASVLFQGVNFESKESIYFDSVIAELAHKAMRQ